MRSGLSRTAIKYMVTLLMVINHGAQIFMPEGGLLREFLISIGYVTAITMCFFLVEGYAHTHDRKAYLRRLFIFALISQLPFDMAFTKEGVTTFTQVNFLGSLTLAFSLLCITDEWEWGWKRNTAIIAIILMSLISDWDIFTLLFVLMFREAGKDRRKIVLSTLFASVLFGGSFFLGRLGEMSLIFNSVSSLMYALGMFSSVIFTVFLYNGEKGRSGRFTKWWFYAFYPLHLLIFGLLRIFFA